MGNCLLCKMKIMKCNTTSPFLKLMGAPCPVFKSKCHENKLKTCKQIENGNLNCCSSNGTSSKGSTNNFDTPFNTKFKDLFHNSNENMDLALNRNNNRHASNASSKYTDSNFLNNVNPSVSNSRKLPTSIPKRMKRNRIIRNKHVFCDSSLETESNSNGSTNLEISQKTIAKPKTDQHTHLFHISRIPPPSPIPNRRKLEFSGYPKNCLRQLEQPMIEYTFYVMDKEICRRPLFDKRVTSIVSNCNCFVKIHSQLTNNFFAEQHNRKIFYKGNPVIPVTLKSYNMSCLRKCIGRLDIHFPYFNVKAFLNS